MVRIKLADYGVTICQGCDKSLNDRRRPTTEVDGTEVYHVQRGGFTCKRERPVKRRMHTSCVRADEKRVAAAMRDAKVQNMTDLYAAYRTKGLTPAEIEAMMRSTDLSDAEITQIMGTDR